MKWARTHRIDDTRLWHTSPALGLLRDKRVQEVEDLSGDILDMQNDQDLRKKLLRPFTSRSRF